MAGDDLAHLRELLDERWKAHAREHEDGKVALDKAAKAVDGRLEDMNELRAQINTERGAYAKTDALSSLDGKLSNAIYSVEKRVAALETKLVAAIFGVGVVFAIVELLTKFWH